MTYALHTRNYVAGQSGTGDGQHVAVIDPSTGTETWSYRADGEATVAGAVDAAAAAYPDWSRATPAERSTALTALAGELDSIAGDLTPDAATSGGTN